MAIEDGIDLLDQQAEATFPGWRPMLRGLRMALAEPPDTLVWDPLSARPRFARRIEKMYLLELAGEVLSTTCERCGALGSRMAVGDALAIRCAAHCDRHPDLPGVWEALEGEEWVITREGDVVRVADLSATDRRELAEWLVESAHDLATEALGRALVAAHHAGTARDVKAALRAIPSHDPDRARKHVERSLLYQALTQTSEEDAS
ncbi:hypothetical protein M3148_16425 [Georgenia satyanarayanai]|uniref:hypothetical protein n=1 Tax=Georgenia satyanarayanai TaxID=860221 RepID=UPI002040B253|nr:hypothetical protein [Georgenia satyanarayanai]MCM3662563.1 hypothetical protein [Georgenia satyanarayanai]